MWKAPCRLFRTEAAANQFVCNLVFATRYMRPEGPWQRRAFLNNLFLPRTIASSRRHSGASPPSPAPQSNRFSFLLEGGAEIRSPSNKKGELVQPQLFRATPHSSRTLFNHLYTIQDPTPSPPLRCAVTLPVHASTSVALPNPFINELQFVKLAAPRIPQCAPFATRPSAVES